MLHEPRIVVTNLFNEDSDEEMRRLEASLGSLRLSIDDMLSRRDVAFEGEHRAVLEAYRMFANDSGWARRLDEAVRNGLTAEAAVEKVQSDMRARMLHMTDPYLRERMSDFDDLANRLLRQLMGRGPDTVAATLPKDAIVVARSMGAAELLDYPRDKLRGLVLEEGAITSHVVIVARAIGIPVAGQVKGAVSMSENGDAIIVDGEEGAIHLRPQSDLEAAYAEKVRFRARRQELYRELRKKPSVTRDGVHIDLMMNAGLAVDLPQLAESGAAGIGLFRTELQFMVASTFPRAEAQEGLYRDVLDAARDKPVTFRTIDIGGDKVLPYFKNTSQEENPALGWRAIRLTLDRPGLLRTQIRALLKAAGGRELKLMLPMVTELGEIAQAREIIDREVRHLSRFAHHLPTSLKVGAMLEVPSLLWQLDELMKAVDFVSVGSNDLFQFMMAADRGNTQLSDRFDTLSVPFLRALKQIADAGAPQQHAGDAVRRTRRQADLGDGADRPRLPLDLDVAGLDRPGQGDADRTRRRRAAEFLRRKPLRHGRPVADARAAAGVCRRPLHSLVKPDHDQPAPRPDGPTRQAFRHARSADGGRAGRRRLRQARVGIFRPAGPGRQDPRTAQGRGRACRPRGDARRPGDRPRDARPGRGRPAGRRGADRGTRPARSRSCCCPRIRPTRRTPSSKSAPAPAATRRRCSPATCSACTSATPPRRAGASRSHRRATARPAASRKSSPPSRARACSPS